MNIIVTVKQVPNTSEIKIDPVTNTLKRDGVPSIINPDDKAALEEALVLKDKYGARVTAVCMGPAQADKALREALAMGADCAVLISDRAFAGSDTLATSKILAAAISKLGYDLIICGRQAIDGDTAQVGPQIAEHLNIPQVTYVQKIDYNKANGEFTVTRWYEEYTQTIAVVGPALFTVLSGANKPRYMRVAGIVAQDGMQVENVAFADLDVKLEEIGLKGSPTRVKSTFTKLAAGGGQKYELAPKEAAALIAEQLKSKLYI
ncbi:MAG: electron transfer flavoprotein subunit beta/FixA family protein [Clostridiales bacterium]|jgi:electron transfer flavoprotein beta subunit|nr:electron transfer flavoprotein subunit beta/FixA family protein [Clostridiales bacterium]